MKEPQRLTTLRNNTERFRAGIKKLGLKSIEGITPIVPVMVGDTAVAIQMQKALLEQGVFVSGFGYPVVPKGEARLRAQISAAHSADQLDRALQAFERVGNKFGLID